MAYATVAGVKAYLGLTGSTYDTFLAAGITFCSELADEWSLRAAVPGTTLGQAFLTHQTSETWFVDGHEGVLLPEWPIQSIVSVTDDDVTIESSKYRLYKDGWLQFLDASDKMPLPRWGKIVVTWNGGYSSAPAGVLEFVRRGCSYLLQRRMHEGVGADLLGATQVTFRPPRVANKPTSELRDIFEETAGRYRLDYLVESSGGGVL